MGLPKEVADLIERFDRNREAYKFGQYNEMQLRQEFLDPFFGALGWDMNNQQGHAEAYKDVIHEDSIKVGDDTKAPDYCFRIGGTRKFFLEAKKPSVFIKEDIAASFQLRRYAWSAKLPLSILCDFEEFAIYDARIKPEKNDKASNARIHYFSYKEYEKQWDLISSVFSREAVLRGSFDKYAEKSRLKKGTATVDDAFLKEIEDWRDMLARNIALRNAGLTTRELNFAVQRTIDRIVFLRICEDRGIEEYGRLQAQLNGTNVYKRLVQLFSQADDRYNSGLFHFQREKERHEDQDKLTPNISIDDKPLKDIINRLYYPESPYEFSVLSADILGQVYEQFLGKVIRLTAGHQAKVEEKPEVRKAGGVYYTPKYIVDYIVKNTVGKLLEGQGASSKGQGLTPNEAAKLKVLDPACGSGSFLLGAYQYLLDWHLKWYIDNEPDKWAKVKQPAIFQGPSPDPNTPNWNLTTAEKKRILLNNIYGVDIDSQAVEVTKLSLLLKVLEGESNQTLAHQLRMFHERALPDLGDNIKCGNSLIGPDFYQQQTMLDDEERYRVNVFDWENEFPHVFSPSPREGEGRGEGGFNAVIGNPPYGASFDAKEAEYFKRAYSVFGGVKDVYTCFVEKSLSLMNKGGRHSFIVPSAWLGGPDYKKLREHILQYQIESIVLLPFDVFKDAYVDTTVFVIEGHVSDNKHEVQTRIYPKHEKLLSIGLKSNLYTSVHQSEWMTSKDKKFVLDPGTVHLLDKISKQHPDTFDDAIRIKRGVLFDKALLTKNKTGLNSYRYFEGDVYRYQINLVVDQWIEFNDEMKERPKEVMWFEGPRILLRRLVNRRQRMMASLAADTFITNKNLYSVLPKDKRLSSTTILGILNSRLISYLYINQVTQATKDDFPQVTIKDVLSLPFPSVIKDKSLLDKMVALVDQMLSLNKKLPEAKTDHDKTALQRQIDATDQQLDKLVYELYGLTEEEIKIVEAART